jgi:RNA polymerase sigma-70 factor, ECF subfamily
VGEFMAVAATRGDIGWPGITVLQFDGGRVVERFSPAGMLGLLAQRGALPAAPERLRVKPGVSTAGVSACSAAMRCDDPLAAVPYRRLSDEALVVRAGRAEAAALAEFYERYRAPARGLAWRILGDAQLAEDAVQDAFLSAWRSAWRFSPERGQARMWILAMVHHRAVDIVRSRGGREVHEPLELAPEQVDRFAEEALEAIADCDCVRRALRSLPTEFRAPLVLAYYADLTQQECAERLREPLGTVKSRSSRGVTRLRERLADPGAAY